MSVTVTDKAAEHIRGFLADEGPDAAMRLAVKPTGCSGFMYVVETTDSAGEHDTVFETHGIRVVVDSQSLQYLDGTEVDFSREGLNTGLRFNNPNVKDTCGCGESFSL
ncbi:MAG: iron-sulfur cluster assembly accessory protein [Gammaproteobacteria bacterium]|nr:iron-sulfur cluster assembly accessory protein [Gammaproteobacteria bacterium]NNM00694.1 iron-sulfur cluster assembly accessory protein [Gammaproteobacteria bacterium]